jgi:hypothetical protein
MPAITIASSQFCEAFGKIIDAKALLKLDLCFLLQL